MPPERLAEIHEHDRRDRERGSVTASMVADIADHRTELLAEVQRLTDELDAWGQRESADAAAGSYAARAETAETERDEARAIIRAIRGWTRSRLEILDHLRPQSGQNAGKITILNDLTSVLDHLAADPAAAVDGTR